ncbi:hypothetical protein [Dictyobacter formicarum]|uniref:Uncharacterized protein n=1 Tax=Dictyobacter formicarum TaxID=2778368 RepID=A0ABQ3VR22_9CHLR|nr:hypothetical protein [Dictyobacter formicarum]GHO87556.1 hypothetical protein KSZ_55620 [Dictyobacter formicarum]
MVLTALMKLLASLTPQAQVVGIVGGCVVLCYGLTLLAFCRTMSQRLVRVLNAWHASRTRARLMRRSKKQGRLKKQH